jgi:TRAP-type mannitol/chloroaromatic compound transport system substrate-binding protein
MAVAPNYLFPGFNKPNGASELLIGLKLWTDLPKPIQAAIETACVAEHATALAEAHAANTRALADLRKTGVRIMRLSDADLDRARQRSSLIRDRLRASSHIAERIIDDQQTFLAESRRWSTLSRV